MEACNNEAFRNYNDKVLEPCPNCGRTFQPDRLQVHMRSCKGPGVGSGSKPVGVGAAPRTGGLGLAARTGADTNSSGGSPLPS